VIFLDNKDVADMALAALRIELHQCGLEGVCLLDPLAVSRSVRCSRPSANGSWSWRAPDISPVWPCPLCVAEP
jgi:hypothetical protein